MPKTLHFLRTLAVCITVLALGSISSVVLAWKADKLSPWVGETLEGKPCAGLLVGFGPYDYLQRASLPGALEVVEESHFNEDVESLKNGQTSSIVNDIHYTLSAWPNHHRALNSIRRYRLERMGAWPDDATVPPAECYLRRAMKFSPNDPRPYMMYGLLMHKAAQYDEALLAYQAVIRLLPNDIMTQYNMGLTLVALEKYPEAQAIAEKVYAAGIPLPGLKRKLIEAGHWKSPADAVARKDAQQATAGVTTEAQPAKAASPDETTKETTTAKKATP